MRYAILRDETVSNLVELNPDNASEFPGAIILSDIPAGIGDAYTDGTFCHDGVVVQTPVQEAEATIAELDSAVVDLEYRNALLTLGIE